MEVPANVIDDTPGGGSIGIGELSRRTGVPVRTIRFYCDEAVLESRRTSGGHRVFDPAVAVDRLLLVRRLRALGLGLGAIVDVLAGATTIEDAVATERAALDAELAVLAWRRAALLAVESAPPAARLGHLEPLAAVADRGGAQDAVVTFWRRVLTPLPPATIEAFLAMHVPALPVAPQPWHVLVYAELSTLAADPTFRVAMSRRLRQSDGGRIRHERELLGGVGEACEAVGRLLAAHQPPRPGPELDRFVAAHAAAREERDTPRFRRRLLCGAKVPDHRIPRYWQLTSEVTGTVTVGDAQHWLLQALALGLDDR
ncbi:MerR family transcriptional regulator [Nocardia wallacei]|uniref:MerR family transcriptional regulator n=1 Tax=Nocardia wallacei TaxID=480035 RepID=UPI00245867A5|nr:MerR family transcriptional regulator [Nocardia wallacei]